VLTIVMREVGGLLVPPGDAMLPAGQHGGFIAHMAALHGAFWGWDDRIGLTSMAQRARFFAPHVIAAELSAPVVPAAPAAAGWAALAGRSPVLWRLARLVHGRPQVLTGPLAATPSTFLAGDWKLGNLAATATGGPSWWTGPFPAPGPPAGSCAGAWRSTGPGCPNPRRP
jgi:hypothetical protein